MNRVYLGLASSEGNLLFTDASSTDGVLRTTSVSQKMFFGIGSNVASTMVIDGGNIGIGTSVPEARLQVNGLVLLKNNVVVDGPELVVPRLSTSSREENIGTPSDGMIIYNTTTSSFEGYTSGAWGSLGGVKNIEGDTFITALTSNELQFVTSDVQRMVIDSNGDVGIGTTQPDRMLDVVGEVVLRSNVLIDGPKLAIPRLSLDDRDSNMGSLGDGHIIYNTTTETFEGYGADGWGNLGGGNGSVYVSYNQMEWREGTAPSLVMPSSGGFTSSTSRSIYRFAGREVMTNIVIEGTVTSAPSDITDNVKLTLQHAIELDSYIGATIIGELWLTVTLGELVTTFKAYAQTIPSNAEQVVLRYLSGSTDSSLAEIDAESTIHIEGTLVYSTDDFSVVARIPILPAAFFQDENGAVVLNGDGGNAPRGRFDIIESNAVPALVIEHIGGSNSDIFRVLKDGVEQLKVGADGNVGIGTSVALQKLDVNGLIRSSGLSGSRALVSGSGGVIQSSSISVTQLEQLTGISSNVQGQLDGKLALSGGTISGDLSVSGSFVVNGSTTTLNTETVTVEDNIILLNAGLSNAPPQFLVSGIEVQRGSESNYLFVFEESSQLFKVGISNQLQAVATRPDSVDDRTVAIWDSENDQYTFVNDVVVNSVGNVGIGTVSPLQKLHVEGTIRSSTISTNTVLVANGHSDIVSSSITTTELGYLSGSTSNIQGQLNGKEATITGAATTITSSDLTTSLALVSDDNGKVAVSSITTTELGYLSGSTSNIQWQLDGKEATITGAATTITSSNLTTSKALVSDDNGKVAVSSITTTELGYLSGSTSNIQGQLDGKEATITGAATTITSSNLSTSKALVSDDNGKVAVSSITTTELGYLSGSTSNIQGQLNGKEATITGAATTITSSNLTTSKALVSDDNGKVAVSSITTTELGYLSGSTSNIQGQLNGKEATITGAATTITSSNLSTSKALVSDDNGKVAVSSITTTELGYLSGSTSNIQGQLDGKEATITGAATTITSSNLTTSKALVSDDNGKVAVSSITTTELGYLSGSTSNIQGQLNGKEATITGAATTITSSDLTTSLALVSDDNGKVAVSSITTTELGYLSGSTSNIQGQLDGKEATITGAATTITSSNLTTSKALVSDDNGKVAVSSITTTELGYLSGSTSNIQGQLDEKLPLSGGTISGNLVVDGPELVVPRLSTHDRNNTIASLTNGLILYNTSTSNFEGYAAGAWGSLGGVKDVEGITFISAEDEPGAKNYQLRFFTSNLERMTLQSNGELDIFGRVFLEDDLIVSSNVSTDTLVTSGNVGIGTAEPEYKLQVQGNVHAVGNITATGTISAFSDRRFKKDITTIPNALELVNKLQGVYYTPIEAEERRLVGVIAQEIEQILPEVVVTDDSTDQKKSVAYGNITAVLIEAVKELSAQVTSLRRELGHM
jgi:fructose-specific component phosphotransferase system IIB-like protein